MRTIALPAAIVALCLVQPAHGWSPAVNYAINCQGCHLADGSATPDLVPPLRGAVGQLVRVPEGRAYLVRLPNVASTTLTDAETAALLNWVVETFGAGERPHDFAPFTAVEVAAHRGAPLVDVEGERRAVLAKVAAAGGGPIEPSTIGRGSSSARQ